MPYPLILPKRLSRGFGAPQQKPTDPVEIDWSNPITRGLVFFLPLQGNLSVLRGPSGGFYSGPEDWRSTEWVLNGGAVFEPGRFGMGVRFDSAGDSIDTASNVDPGFWLDNGIGLTFLTLFEVDDWTVANQRIYGMSDSFEFATWESGFDYSQQIYDSSGVHADNRGDGVGRAALDSKKLLVMSNGWEDVVVPPRRQAMYVNGEEITYSESSVPANDPGAAGTFSVGRRGAAATGMVGNLYGFGLWNRFLSQAEAEALTKNPWQIVRPKRQRRLFFPTGVDEPIYVGNASNGSNNSTSIGVTHGLTINERDVVVVWAGSDINADGMSIDSSGWHESIVDGTVPNETMRYCLWWKYAGASEPATYTVSHSSSGEITAHVMVARANPNYELILDAVDIGPNKGGTLPQSPSLDVSAKSIAFALGGMDTTNEAATGMDNGYTLQSTESARSSSVGYRIWKAGGTTGVVNHTSGNADAGNYGAHIAFRTEQFAQLVQAKEAALTSNASSLNVVLDSAPTAGNLLVVRAQRRGVGSISWPTGWNEVFDSTSDSFGNIALAYKRVEAGDSATITITLDTNPSGMAAYVEEWSGVGVLDVSATNVGDATDVTTEDTGITAATVAPNAIAFAAIGVRAADATAWSWTNDFIHDVDPATSGTADLLTLGCAHKILNATGTVTTTASWTTAGRSGGGVAVFVLQQPGARSRADLEATPTIDTNNDIGAKILRAFPFTEGSGASTKDAAFALQGTQYREDFSGESAGVQASDFTNNTGVSQWKLEGVVSTGTWGDKYIRMENQGTGGTGLSPFDWDTPGSLSVGADAPIEMLARFRFASGAGSSDFPIVSMFHDGDAGNTSGYAALVETDQLSIMYYVNGGQQTRVGTDSGANTRPANGEWWWVRFSVDAANLWSVTFWKDGDTEPTSATASGTDSTRTSGPIGIGVDGFTEALEWDFISYGLNGDPAPFPEQTATLDAGVGWRTNITDTFEGSSLSADWTDAYTDIGVEVVSGGTVTHSSGDAVSFARTAEQYSYRQRSKVTVVGSPTGTYHTGVFVRASAVGSAFAAWDSYSLYRKDASTLELYRVDNGSFTSLATPASTQTANETLELRIDGDELTMWVNDSQVGSAVNDSTYSTGLVGFILDGAGEITSWEGGTLSTDGGIDIPRTDGVEVNVDADRGEMYEFFSGGTAYTAFVLFKFEGNPSDANEYTLLSNSSNQAVTTNASFSDTTINDGKEHSLGFAVNATDGRGYLDGVKKATDATPTSTFHRILMRYDPVAAGPELYADDTTSNHNDLMIGGTHQHAIDRWDGSIELVLLFDSKLSDGEMAVLAANPWQVFNKGAGGPVTISGSGALAAQDATTSGAGTMARDASGTPAAQAATVAGTAERVLTSSGTPAAQDATTAGTATVTPAGGQPSVIRPTTMLRAQAATIAGTGTVT